jgi:hypothetical protein
MTLWTIVVLGAGNKTSNFSGDIAHILSVSETITEKQHADNRNDWRLKGGEWNEPCICEDKERKQWVFLITKSMHILKPVNRRTTVKSMFKDIVFCRRTRNTKNVIIQPNFCLFPMVIYAQTCHMPLLQVRSVYVRSMARLKPTEPCN